VHFVTMAHQLAWMEHPAIWLCESCAILWLVLRVVRSPLVRTGVLLMLCGLGMNAFSNGHQCRVDARGRNAIHSVPSKPDVAECDVSNAGATTGRSSTARTV
jgi:hypothetical protein